MARSEHKKVLQQLSEAYQRVLSEDAEMEFDARGFAKNTKAGKEDEYDQERKDNIEYSKRYESEYPENSKASLAIKLVLELLGEEEHDEAAANAIYMIRDLVK